MPDVPPLLPQVDLNANTDDFQPGQLPATPGEVVGADMDSIGAASKFAYNKVLANLQNSPIRYQNAGQFLSDSAQALADPANAGPLLNNKLLTPDEANTQYWRPGMAKFSTPIFEQAAQTLSQSQDDANKSDAVLQRANMGTVGNYANNVGRSLLSMVDPLSAPLVVTPVLGEDFIEANVAAKLGKGFIGKTVATGLKTGVGIAQFQVASNLGEDTLTAPLGNERSINDYLSDDVSSLEQGGLLALITGVGGAALSRTLSRGSEFFSKLHPDTQEHITDSIASDSDVPFNKVLDGDKNIAEVEAQLGVDGQTADERQTMMSKSPVADFKDEAGTRPMTADELRDAGEPVLAQQVESQGQSVLQDRLDQAKQDRAEGKLDPKDNPVNDEVEPIIKPDADVTEQSAVANKQLTDVESAKQDIITRAQALVDEHQAKIDAGEKVTDAEREQAQSAQDAIDHLTETDDKADEEINRVNGQKSLTESAVQCALNNGI